MLKSSSRLLRLTSVHHLHWFVWRRFCPKHKSLRSCLWWLLYQIWGRVVPSSNEMVNSAKLSKIIRESSCLFICYTVSIIQQPCDKPYLLYVQFLCFKYFVSSIFINEGMLSNSNLSLYDAIWFNSLKNEELSKTVSIKDRKQNLN